MARKEQAAPSSSPVLPQETARPSTSVFTSIGWLAAVFALVPLLMAAHGDGRIYLWSGLAMITVGGVFLVIGRVRQSFD